MQLGGWEFKDSGLCTLITLFARGNLVGQCVKWKAESNGFLVWPNRSLCSYGHS